MLTPELEQLIQYALADGVLTDKERAVLMKKAEAAGADLDEFEMILEAKVHEAKKAAAAAAPKASNKEGEVRKCPHCGSPVSSFRTTCQECGHEFRNLKAVESAAVLFEQIKNLEMEKARELSLHENNKNKQLEAFGGVYSSERRKERDNLTRRLNESGKAIVKKFSEAKISLIKLYAVPNTKQDLIEFLTMAVAAVSINDNDDDDDYDVNGVLRKEGEAWLKKTDQIYQKILIVAADDNETLDQATRIIASLIKRLPLKHKSFTRVPQAQRERIAAEFKMQEQIRKKAYRAKLLSGLVSWHTICVIIGLVALYYLYTTLPDHIPTRRSEEDPFYWRILGIIAIAVVEVLIIRSYLRKAAKATKNETLL